MTTELCPRRKAEIVLALLSGETTFEETCVANNLSRQDLDSWIASALPSKEAYDEAYEVLKLVRRKIRVSMRAGVQATIRFDGNLDPISDYSKYRCSCLPLPEPLTGELILYFSKALDRLEFIEMFRVNQFLEPESLNKEQYFLPASYKVVADTLLISFSALRRDWPARSSSTMHFPEPMDGSVFTSICSPADRYNSKPTLTAIGITGVLSCLPKEFLKELRFQNV